MLWLKIFAKFVKILKEGATPGQLAGGFSIGFFIGLTPGWPLHIILITLILLLLNLNLGMAVIGGTLAVAISWLLDPMIDTVGAWLLEDVNALQSIWISFYNNSLILLTRFNNTVVMGSFTVGLVLLLPIYFLIRLLIQQYRDVFLANLDKWRLTRMIKNSWIYRWYQRASEVGLI